MATVKVIAAAIMAIAVVAAAPARAVTQHFNMPDTVNALDPSAEGFLAGATVFPSFRFGDVSGFLPAPFAGDAGIAVDGSSPNGLYIAGASSSLGILTYGQFEADAGNPALVTPNSLADDNFNPPWIITFTSGPDASLDGIGQYIYVFFSSNGLPVGTYFGTAFVDAAGTLEYIDYSANAIPEPATWALVLIGIGGAGLFARRRRAKGVSAPG